MEPAMISKLIRNDVDMKLHLNETQMLKEWHLRAFPEEVNSGCTIERHYGIDMQAYMKASMDDWYRRLLHDPASLHLLSPVDITDEVGEVTVGEVTPGTSLAPCRIRLPEGVVRVLRVMVEGWHTDARIVDSCHHLAKACRSPFPQGGVYAPIAVVDGDILTLYSVPAQSPVVKEIIAIVDTPGIYHIDSAAFATIKPIF